MTGTPSGAFKPNEAAVAITMVGIMFRWCFADPEDAKAFQAEFGGELIRVFYYPQKQTCAVQQTMFAKGQ